MNARPKPSVSRLQRLRKAEDEGKPLFPGVALIHNASGFGYIVDSIAEEFGNPERVLVILRRTRLLGDSLHAVSIDKLRNAEEWAYVGL